MTHQGTELGEGYRVPPHMTLPRTPLLALSCSSFKLQPGRAPHRQRAPSPVPKFSTLGQGPTAPQPPRSRSIHGHTPMYRNAQAPRHTASAQGRAEAGWQAGRVS